MNLGHQEQGFHLWKVGGGCSPPSSDALLSNSLKQNVHTDTASWKRKTTRRTRHPHPPHEPIPCRLKHLPLQGPQGGGQLPRHLWGLTAGPGLAKNEKG